MAISNHWSGKKPVQILLEKAKANVLHILGATRVYEIFTLLVSARHTQTSPIWFCAVVFVSGVWHFFVSERTLSAHVTALILSDVEFGCFRVCAI